MRIKVEEECGKTRVILMDDEKEVAKATCYYKDTPKYNEKEIGTIGEFEAVSKEAGVEILKRCEEILKEKCIEMIVAPMNGTTWKQYRTLKYSNGDPFFILEKVNSSEYNDMLKEAGYKELHTYSSTKGKIAQAYISDTFEIIEESLKEEGITLKNFNKKDYMNDLKKIYNISVKSFSRNPFYTPITENEFLKQYIAYIQMVDEELILIAQKGEKEIGFVFCIPDFNELQTKGKVTTLVLKTIAVLPEYEDYAIGNVMLNKIRKIAIDKGFDDWIFAFMFSDNTSQKMAKRNNTNTIREYALYGKEI